MAGGAAMMKVLLDAGGSIYKAVGRPKNRLGSPRSSAALSAIEAALTFILRVARWNHSQTMAVILDNSDVQKAFKREHWMELLERGANPRAEFRRELSVSKLPQNLLVPPIQLLLSSRIDFGGVSA